MKRLLIIVGFLSVSRVFFAQDVQIVAEFDTNKIFIGDQIHFTIKLEKPKELILNLPVFKDSLIKNVEIISGPQTDTITLQNGNYSIISKYLVTSFDSGRYQIPPVFAEVNDANGIKRYYSNYSSLEVSRVSITPQDSTDVIFDIIKPYRAPLTISEVLPWFLIVVACLLIFWYLIRLIKKRKYIKTSPEIGVSTDPAHIIAFRELSRLKNDALWQKGEVKLYYTRLSEILRQYLENRYFISSMELTTDETLAIYKKTVKPESSILSLLKSVLINSDLVKFAKYKPGPSENETAFEDAWKYISNTMVKAEETTETIVDNKTEEAR